MFYPLSKRSARWDAIKAAMGEWATGRTEPKAWNNSLKGYITVNRRFSARETGYWGSKRDESTQAICNHFNEILRFAVKRGETEPHTGARSKFRRLIILERRIDGLGVAKLTVGERFDGSLVQYCITAGDPTPTAIA